MATRKPKRTVATLPISKRTDKKQRTATVNYTRDELNLLLPSYYMIRDCVDGEQAIKGFIPNGSDAISYDAASLAYNGGGSPSVNFNLQRAKRYLPQPNAEDVSPENTERYRSYVQRAVFYNVTGRTLEGMAGQIFLRDPIIEVPDLLKPLLTDADGCGVTLIQQAKRGARNLLAYGRAGIHVDYPTTNGPASLKQLEDGEVRPIITLYEPWNVLNWRTAVVGAKKMLSLVVLRELVYDESDEFETQADWQYRVLKLDPVSLMHTAQIYRKVDSGFTGDGEYTPTDAKGNTLREIPFKFIGSEANDAVPDKPPIYDLASLNIAHYRNSADYEEACFLVGQPTPVVTGLTEEWVKNVLKGSIPLGSRATISLPVGADAKLLQANANQMPKEAMGQKEEQMVAIGAKLVQKNRTTRPTATEVVIETTSESSVLTNISKNTSDGFVWALGVAADFVGAPKDTIKFKLNTDFDLTKLSPEGQATVIKAWQSGVLAWEEVREVLRKAELATLSDDDAKTKIMEEAAAMTAAGAVADPFGRTVPTAPAAGAAAAGAGA